MGRTIRVDDEVYAWLKAQAKLRGLEFKTPNAVLRAIADLPVKPKENSNDEGREQEEGAGDC